jgi:hypothetical protein
MAIFGTVIVILSGNTRLRLFGKKKYPGIAIVIEKITEN